MLSASRRDFLTQASLLTLSAVAGTLAAAVPSARFSKNSGGIRVVDKSLAFIENPQHSDRKQVPDGFLFTHHPLLPEVEHTRVVDFKWGKETFTNGSLGAINQLGAINEGVFVDGERILQIVASTPGTPDTGTGSVQYKNWYRISADGGKTFSDFKLIVQEGYTKDAPLLEVVTGRNGYTTPFTSPILKSANGEIMVPVNLHPWDDENQKIYNPADAFLFADSGVLVGKWNNDKSDVTWSFGNWLRIDHNRSTRGLCEPSLAELPGKRTFAMVMRGSNYKRLELPSRAWVSFSSDQCRSWSYPVPFTYSDGTPFYVPASCSTLFRARHSGKLYWIGNLSDKNPEGSHPRSPLVIGQVSEDHFGLMKETVVKIDQPHPEFDDTLVELSNFKVLEHFSRNEIMVMLTRRTKGKWAEEASWYHIALD